MQDQTVLQQDQAVGVFGPAVKNIMSVLRHCQLWTGEEPASLPDDIHTYSIKLDLFAQQPYLSRSFGQWKDTGNFEDIFRRMHLCQLYDFFSRNCRLS